MELEGYFYVLKYAAIVKICYGWMTFFNQFLKNLDLNSISLFTLFFNSFLKSSPVSVKKIHSETAKTVAVLGEFYMIPTSPKPCPSDNSDTI